MQNEGFLMITAAYKQEEPRLLEAFYLISHNFQLRKIAINMIAIGNHKQKASRTYLKAYRGELVTSRFCIERSN
jgi:hypothetical protein